ncbi:MAG TPA: glycosyltransferase family protein [Sedimentisphaerales bacterium]|nr:glycosyltransferase family protein [Sedimentisphaerales bacterium]
MARIIYGVAGEGYGHSTRSHVIAQRLLDRGHDLLLAGSNKSLSYLRQYFGHRVQEVFGLGFEIRNGRVLPLRTVLKNLRKFKEMNSVNGKLRSEHFDPFRPDLVISDFEPFCAHWARRNRVPFVSIDNEHLLTHCRLEAQPADVWSGFMARAVIRSHYWGARAYVVPSFFDAPARKSNVLVVPPVIRQPVMDMTPTEGNHIVVYLTAGHNSDELADMLNSSSGHEFHIYGFDRTDTVGRCMFRSHSTEGFLADLASSKGVVATAGFSLISECIHFRKKLLVLPLEGQYEQLLNADYVESLGLGSRSRQIDEQAISRLIMETEKPVSNDRRILWPDNEKVFVMLDALFQKLGIDIRLSE